MGRLNGPKVKEIGPGAVGLHKRAESALPEEAGVEGALGTGDECRMGSFY